MYTHIYVVHVPALLQIPKQLPVLLRVKPKVLAETSRPHAVQSPIPSLAMSH